MKKIENKQYLVFLILSIIGAPMMMSMIPFISVIGCLAVIICIPSLSTSVFTREKFLGSRCVILDNGEKYHFSVVKENHHHAFIFLIPFLSFFYFIPIKRKYILIHNMGCNTLDPNTKIPSEYCTPDAIMDSEYISKKQYKLLMKNPQAFKDTLQFRLNKRKTDFYAFSPLLEKALEPKQIVEKNNYVIYEQEKFAVAFIFNGDAKRQNGIVLTQTIYNKYKENLTENLFSLIITTSANTINDHYLVFTEENLQKSLYVEYFKEREKAKESSANDTENVESKMQTTMPDTPYLNNTDEPKIVITNERISNNFAKPAPFKYRALKYLMYFLIFEFTGASIVSLFMAGPLVLVFCIPLIIVFYLISKFAKKKIQERTIPGKTSDFKVIKTVCIDINDITPISDDPDYIPAAVYEYTFLNNRKITGDYRHIIEFGVPYYIVYSTETNKFVEIINSKLATLAPDVQYEDELQ